VDLRWHATLVKKGNLAQISRVFFYFGDIGIFRENGNGCNSDKKAQSQSTVSVTTNLGVGWLVGVLAKALLGCRNLYKDCHSDDY